ncbi:MAG: sigma-54-dependent Fis family transcriptional regulator, partial [Bacteroidales bacterium]|nr:sigma-54-dependent Fis family transcriptional regulator [Bacteroidales bacterium]
TLFLDEIGELPRETQALLLRVLQNGEFMKVGSSKVEKTDVRVIAATNVNLAYAVATGKFREDLYYRLTGIQIQMPALRERNKDDIYLLFRKFTSDFSERYNLCKVSLSHEAISMLTAYRWPGNIRQLKNVAETVTALESRPVTPGSERIELGPAALMRYLPDEKDSMLPATTGPQPAGSMPDSDKQMIVKAILDLKQEVDRLKELVQAGGGAQPAMPAGLPHYVEMAPDEPEEQLLEPETAPEGISIRKMGDELIERALAKHGGKVKAAAAELGVSERTIYRKLAEWKNNGKKA